MGGSASSPGELEVGWHFCVCGRPGELLYQSLTSMAYHSQHEHSSSGSHAYNA